MSAERTPNGPGFWARATAAERSEILSRTAEDIATGLGGEVVRPGGPAMEHRLHEVGDRVRLVRCDDPYTRLQPGELGTVRFIDDTGTVHVAWDSGSHLGMVFEAGDRIEATNERWWCPACAAESRLSPLRLEGSMPAPGALPSRWSCTSCSATYEMDGTTSGPVLP